MKIFIKILALVCILAGAFPVYADREGCGLRDKVEHLEQRIERGIEDGKLTPREVRWLEQERSEIRRLYRDLRDDDMLGTGGCDILERRIDRLNDQITELKNNDRSYDRRDYEDRPDYDRR